MIKLVFTNAEKDGLQRERHPHPDSCVRLKMEVVWLKSQNLRHQESCRLTGVCSTTLTGYLRSYQEGGIGALKIRKPYRPQSDLDAHPEMLEAHFRKHPPATTQEALATIESITGIRRSPRRIQEFFKRVGMKRRKVGMIPAKADVEAQERFKKNSWSRALKKPRPASGQCSLSTPPALGLGTGLGDSLVFCRSVYSCAGLSAALQCAGRLADAITHKQV